MVKLDNVLVFKEYTLKCHWGERTPCLEIYLQVVQKYKSIYNECVCVCAHVMCRERNDKAYGTLFREGNGTPFQYLCLENAMDGEAWYATVHGVAKSWTRLSD